MALSPGYLLQIERLDGRVAVLEVRWSDLRHDATVGGLVLTLRDVTEQHELEEELKHRAFHDALTGLPNRALFAREAAGALEAARAVGRTAGVLFVDLDDFKVVNDTMGHSVGDELLVAVAARLAASVRQSDTAARLGGDEFALLIDDAADPEDRGRVRGADRGGVHRAVHSQRGQGARRGDRRRGDVAGQRRRGRTAAPRGPRPVRGEDGGQAALAALPAGADQRDAQAARNTGRA